MCEFISWVQKEQKVYFLTSDEVNSQKGMQIFYPGCRHNDLIGHGAIKEFFKEELGGKISSDMENQDFWYGYLPKEVKEAWNSGKLDSMLKYLQGDDLDFILIHAPANFVKWCIFNIFEDKGSINFTNNNNSPMLRLAYYVMNKNYEAMKKEVNEHIHLLGCLFTKDYQTLKKSIYTNHRLIAYLITKDFKSLKEDRGMYNVHHIPLSNFKTFKSMKLYSESHFNKNQINFAGLFATKDFEAMKKFSGPCFSIKLAGYLFGKQNYKAMQNEREYPGLCLLGYFLENKFKNLKRPLIK
ncbi:MAG: hypothetical protein ACP5OG_02165 [Candidatus Nanoarchaeia archaeon]